MTFLRRQSGALSIGAVLCLVSGAGCGSKDCETVADETARDWCWYEQSVDAAADGRMDDSLAAIAQISTQMVKASAIDKLFLNAPNPIDQTTAQKLCGELEHPQSDNCLRTWNRPHLWARTPP